MSQADGEREGPACNEDPLVVEDSPTAYVSDRFLAAVHDMFPLTRVMLPKESVAAERAKQTVRLALKRHGLVVVHLADLFSLSEIPARLLPLSTSQDQARVRLVQRTILSRVNAWDQMR